VTGDQAAAELATVLTNNDGWGDGYVLVRRDTLATYLGEGSVKA
jgi:hypothetical protein